MRAWAEALDALESSSQGEIEPLLRELALAVRGQDKLGRELARERAVKALQGKVTSPARIVDAALAEQEKSQANESGEGMVFREPEPWAVPVEGQELLSEIAGVFSTYLVLPHGGERILALWVVHTYALEATNITPRLAITSPEKRCGKTTLLDLLGILVKRPLSVANISAAAFFRSIGKFGPTLLIDEADTFLPKREELRGVLNSGHRRGGNFVRCAGDDFEPGVFPTFCPVAIASIGKLPDTLSDRSIEVAMRRQAIGERVERLRLDRLNSGDIASRIVRWVSDHSKKLRSADPELPEEMHDRARDNWRPLLAIADLAGGEWPEEARRVALSTTVLAEDLSHGTLLLTDIQAIFESRREDRIFTDELLRELTGLDDRPWAEWRGGREMAGPQLAKLLRPYGIRPAQLRIGSETRKGYLRSDFGDAFSRYLPAVEPKHTKQDNGTNDLESAVPETLTETGGGARFGPSAEKHRAVSDVSSRKGDEPLTGVSSGEWGSV